VPPTKVLAAMDTNRPLFSDASAYPVCAFKFLRPDTSNPNTPMFELFSFRRITAMVNGYAMGVAKQNDVPLLADDRIKTIDFVLGMHNDIVDRLARSSDFALGDDVGRRPSTRVEMIFSRAPPPGIRHFLDNGNQIPTVNNGVYVIEMRSLRRVANNALSLS
jgi:hypothetical protein